MDTAVKCRGEFLLPVARQRPVSGSSPGPQAYDISELTRFGRTNVPCCRLSGRIPHGGCFVRNKIDSPGPGAYSPEHYGSIQWNCAPKGYLREESSQHTLQSTRSTVTLRPESVTPGPGAYGITPLECYKTKPPGVKLAGGPFRSNGQP